MELGFIMIAPVMLGAMLGALLLVWVERRLLGFWQDRLGPNRVGPFGIMQMVADLVKLLTKTTGFRRFRTECYSPWRPQPSSQACSWGLSWCPSALAGTLSI